MDVMKKALSMGTDEMVLVQDDALSNVSDSMVTASVLASAIKKIGHFDMIISGRQASDWDNAQVPLGVAELLGLACVSLGKKVSIDGDKVVVERLIPDGFEVVHAPMPSLVTVSNELGQPRYPTLRGIMAATRKLPTIWASNDLGISPDMLEPRVTLHDLFIPERDQVCEMIEGDKHLEAARNLALKLREANLF